MEHPANFMISHSFCAVELSRGNPRCGPTETFNGIECFIGCRKMKGSQWECWFFVLKDTLPSLVWKVEFKIRTKNGVETVGTRDGRIEQDNKIPFLDDPKYFVNGNMTIECHVEVYKVDGNRIRKPRTVIKNETGIGFLDQKSLLAIEEKELQTAISLSKKEFKQAMAKEKQKAKELQNKKDSFSCNICLEKYGEEGDRTPRVLDCGHTLCLGCCKQIARPPEIQCPFCRVVTQLTGRTVSNLPKNFLALSM